MKCRSRGHTRHEATRSPPSRGAWIEIALVYDGDIAAAVAPLAGGVD